MAERFTDVNDIKFHISRRNNIATVYQNKLTGFPKTFTCKAKDIGDGFLISFPMNWNQIQDAHVCLTYKQAQSLVLALSQFKQELWFK